MDSLGPPCGSNSSLFQLSVPLGFVLTKGTCEPLKTSTRKGKVQGLDLSHRGVSKEKGPVLRLEGGYRMHLGALSPRTSKIFPVYNLEWESAMDSKP